MNATHLVRTGHRVGLLALAVAAILAASAACALPGSASASSSHSCADKIAKAALGQTVQGSWGCLTSKLQQSLGAYGEGTDDATIGKIAGGPPPSGYTLTETYVGSDRQMVLYDIAVTTPNGSGHAELTVWIDAAGHVKNFGVASPLF